MKSKLEHIISELVKNQELLQQEIENCIADYDFLGAHYHSIALKKVGGKIQTFQNLVNPNYDKIVMLERHITMYKSKIQKDEHNSMSEYFTSKINELESDVLKLKNENINFRNRTHVFAQKLEELIKSKVSKIRLVLIEKHSVCLDFVKSGKALTISIKEDSFKDVTFGNQYQIGLKNLGFQKWNEIYSLEVSHFNISEIEKVLEVVSRIVFDIFYFKSLDNPMTLKYL